MPFFVSFGLQPNETMAAMQPNGCYATQWLLCSHQVTLCTVGGKQKTHLN